MTVFYNVFFPRFSKVSSGSYRFVCIYTDSPAGPNPVTSSSSSSPLSPPRYLPCLGVIAVAYTAQE